MAVDVVTVNLLAACCEQGGQPPAIQQGVQTRIPRTYLILDTGPCINGDVDTGPSGACRCVKKNQP
jgi:hypothetical protein